MKNYKWRLFLWMCRKLGYRNLLSEREGITVFIGNKYKGKGWHTIVCSFNHSEAKAETTMIDEVSLFNRSLKRKEVKKLKKYYTLD